MPPLVAQLLAADEPPTLWQRLDEVTRGRVTLTLVGLLLLAALMVLLIAISARMMRRMRATGRRFGREKSSDWDRKGPTVSASER